MNIIIFDENKEVFETTAWNVPDSIKELYAYGGGVISKELFDKTIDGLNKTGSTTEMVELYNSLALAKPIHKIYTEARVWWEQED